MNTQELPISSALSATDIPEWDAYPASTNKLEPAELPRSPQARADFLGRLLTLFCKKLPPNFSRFSLEAAVNSLLNACPDPTDQNFADFVESRCHGVIDMLRLLLRMQQAGASEEDVVDEAERLGGGLCAVYEGKSLMNIGLKQFSLPPEKMDEIMHARVDRLRDLRHDMELRPQVRELFAKVKRKFTGEKDLLMKVVAAFRENAGRFTYKFPAPEYQFDQWFWVLLQGLVRFEVEHQNAKKVLFALAHLLANARDEESFATAINHFTSLQQKRQAQAAAKSS